MRSGRSRADSPFGLPGGSSPTRAPNVLPGTVNRGRWRSVAVTVNEHRGLARKRETAGQRVSDLRGEWWPGAGSNRRPSDFQVERARPERSPRAEFVLSREVLGPLPSGDSGARVSKSVSKPEPRRVAAARMLGTPLGVPTGPCPCPGEGCGQALRDPGPPRLDPKAACNSNEPRRVPSAGGRPSGIAACHARTVRFLEWLTVRGGSG
jgi:hypothetical protein